MKTALRLLFLLLLSSLAFGQGSIVPPQTALKTVNGFTTPIANATITVCAANTGGIPCSPALVNAIFQNTSLTQPLSNPFTSDAQGNYQFAVAPGSYTVTVTAFGFQGNSYQITVPGTVGTQLAPGQIRQMWVIGDGSNPVFGIGHGNAPAQTGSFAQTLPTATEMGGNNLSAAATASTNTVVGVTGPAAASNGIFTWGTFGSLQMRVRFNTLTNARWWLGLGFQKFQSGSGNANYATDTPNTQFCGFRRSDVTDTTIKAICETSNTNITIVDTGVSVDTVHSQLFGIFPVLNGESFYINNVLVATITTNVPTSTTLYSQLVCGDNKNTNTAINFDFWWSLQTNLPLI